MYHCLSGGYWRGYPVASSGALRPELFPNSIGTVGRVPPPARAGLAPPPNG